MVRHLSKAPLILVLIFGAFIFLLPWSVFSEDEITVAVDIKPGSCPNPINVKSRGVLPVAIVGTDDFDVTMIDPVSIRLMGVAPIRSRLEDVATPFIDEVTICDSCTDLGPDGIMDLTLKFRTQEIVAALGEVNDEDCFALQITGNLKEDDGGYLILGEDVVRILKKGKTPVFNGFGNRFRNRYLHRNFPTE